MRPISDFFPEINKMIVDMERLYKLRIYKLISDEEYHEQYLKLADIAAGILRQTKGVNE